MRRTRCLAIRKSVRNTTSTGRIGNMRMSSRLNGSSTASKVAALAAASRTVEVRIGLPPAMMESMFGSRRGGGGRSNHGFRGQDYTAELHLSLMDAAKTHKQVITVNGKNLRITVPAGVANGQTIKLKGQGGPGMNGGPAGDLYITFIIPDDSRFKRVGDDLYLTVPLNLYTAVLGGEQIIDTLDSKVKLKVKPGTQNNTKVRLKGKGFPVYKKEGQFGDLIVTYSIEVPTNLTEKQKELFREIQSLN